MFRFIVRRLIWAVPTLLHRDVPRLLRDPDRHRPAGQLPAGQRPGEPGEGRPVHRAQRPVRAGSAATSGATSSGSAGSSPATGRRASRATARCGRRSRTRSPTRCGSAGSPPSSASSSAARSASFAALKPGCAARRRRQRLGVGRCCRSRRSSRPCILQMVFAVYTRQWFPDASWLHFPTSGVYPPGHRGFDLARDGRHLTLPVIVVAIQTIAIYTRYMRASLLDVLNSDYLRTARSKGVSERRVLVRHAMRNAHAADRDARRHRLRRAVRRSHHHREHLRVPGDGQVLPECLQQRRLPAS